MPHNEGPEHGCTCPDLRQLEDGTWNIDPACLYHDWAKRHPFDHRSPWNCPTFWDKCNCQEQVPPLRNLAKVIRKHYSMLRVEPPPNIKQALEELR